MPIYQVQERGVRHQIAGGTPLDFFTLGRDSKRFPDRLQHRSIPGQADKSRIKSGQTLL